MIPLVMIPLASALCFAGAAFCVGLLVGIAYRFGSDWGGWGPGPSDPSPPAAPSGSSPVLSLSPEERERLRLEALRSRPVFDAYELLN